MNSDFIYILRSSLFILCDNILLENCFIYLKCFGSFYHIFLNHQFTNEHYHERGGGGLIRCSHRAQKFYATELNR